MTPVLVPVEEVDKVWPLVSPAFVKCLEKTPSYFSAGEMWQECRSGQAALIVIHDGESVLCASVWRFEAVCGRYAFNCVLLAGRQAEKWMDDLCAFVEQVAKMGGAKILTGTGRVGLVSRLKKKFKGLRIARQSYIVEI